MIRAGDREDGTEALHCAPNDIALSAITLQSSSEVSRDGLSRGRASDLRRRPNTVTKAACARPWRSFWGGRRYAGRCERRSPTDHLY